VIRGVSGVLLAAGLLTAAHAQTDYEIRLHRPGKAGDRYHLTAVGHDTKASTATSEGRPPRANRQELAVELEGVVTILDADAAGVSRAEIRIERATREESGKRTELLPAGTTVTELRRGVSQAFEVKGQPVLPDTGEALGLVLSETTTENDDALFGSKARRKAGERWSVNPAGVAELFARPSGGRRMAITPRDVTGSVRLDRVAPCGAASCMTIEVSGTISLPAASLSPQGMQVETSAIDYAFSGLLPVDPARPRLQESARITIRFRGRRPASPDNAPMTLEATLEKRTSRSLSPLP